MFCVAEGGLKADCNKSRPDVSNEIPQRSAFTVAVTALGLNTRTVLLSLVVVLRLSVFINYHLKILPISDQARLSTALPRSAELTIRVTLPRVHDAKGRITLEPLPLGGLDRDGPQSNLARFLSCMNAMMIWIADGSSPLGQVPKR